MSNKISKQSAEVNEEKVTGLKKLFPGAFKDGKMDCELIRKQLGDLAEDLPERYGLSWAGKSSVFRAIQAPTAATLVPDRTASVDFDTTKNIFIEGDNLEVLKVLQKSYHAKVKMIYIDPPYNTGKDFVYHDNFAMSAEEYGQATGDKDETGRQVRGLRKNTKDNGRYHSDWLNMMYPRLFLARNLLRDDGVIFVSIDDNEVHNLRLLMDEIFGEENFVANIVWQKKQSPQNDSTYLSSMHDHILVYAKFAKQQKNDCFGWGMNLLSRTEEQEARYQNEDNDKRGTWTSVDMTSNKTASQRPNLYYPIINPYANIEIWPSKDRVWRYSKEVMNQLIEDDRIWWGVKNDGFPRQKRFLTEVQSGIVPSTWWSRDFAGDNQAAKREIRSLFTDNEEAFDTPKPVQLIKRMLEISTSRDDVILDFFAGSGTTGQAAMELNKEDGGNRRYILVQLPEETEEKSEAHKAGYKTISEITAERLRRAGKKVKVEAVNSHLESGDAAGIVEHNEVDTGFKHFRLSESNFKQWHGDNISDADDLRQRIMEFKDVVKPDSDKEAMLYELLIKSGLKPNLDLNTYIENKGKYYLVDTDVVICLEDNLDQKIVDEILSLSPIALITIDHAFVNEEMYVNLDLKLKREGIIFLTV